MENKKICKRCKGKCCKTMGCHYAPNDFKDLSYEGLKKEIEKGHISIDWWEGNPFDDEQYIKRAYYLRVKNIGGNVVDASWGGICSMLTDKGCKFDYNNRPTGGRLLIAKDNFDCDLSYSKLDCAKEWYIYNDIIEKLVKDYDVEDKSTDLIGFLDFLLNELK